MIAPTQIGKYEIRRQIGRGAMGVVFEAFDPVIERRVAIKTLRLELFESSQIADVRMRFKREAQSAGQLAHPHIVTVYDYGEHEGMPYIAMEFLSGNELSKILGRGSRLPLSEVVRLMTQLLGALSYAHERRVVHRDIKPGNIFILDDGSLKVVDFGLAHVEASNLTDTGALLGTPAYMSPEQFLALPVNERSDIFSAGVILYELLTGDKPFTGSVTSIMQKVLRQEPMEPSALNPTLSTAWDTVVRRAMAKKPDARFQSARQFSETVKQVFEKGALNISVEVTLTGSKVPDPGGETLRPSVDKQDESRAQQPGPQASVGAQSEPAKSFAKLGWAIAAATTVTVGAAAFYAFRGADDTELTEIEESRWTNLQGQKSPQEAGRIADQKLRLLCERRAKEGKSSGKLLQKCAELKEEATATKTAAEKDAREAKLAKEREAADKVTVPAKAATESAAQDEKEKQERAAQEKPAEAKLAAKSDRLEKIAEERALREKTAADAARLEKLRAEKAATDRTSGTKAEKAAQAIQSRLPPCLGSFNAASWTNCVGTHALPSGENYVGEWKDGKPSGQGTQTYPNGMKYVGEFKDGKHNGPGTVTLPNGAMFVGEFRGGMPNGQGTETQPNGIKYVGEFKDGKWDGQGTVTSSEGGRYVGGFKDSKPNGHGTETRPDGRQYVGVWKDGKLNGPGTLMFPDGQKYVGEFKDGKPNGQGSETSVDGRLYVGGFKDGNFNGYGTHTFPGGSKHVGDFKDSQPHGYGVDYRGDGTILRSGIWENGVFVKEMKAGVDKASPLGRLAGNWKASTQSTYPKNNPIPGNFEFRSDGSFSYTNPFGSKMIGSFGTSGNSFSGTGKLRLADVYQGQKPPPLQDGSREATFIFNGEIISETRVRGNYSGGGEMGIFELLKE